MATLNTNHFGQQHAATILVCTHFAQLYQQSTKAVPGSRLAVRSQESKSDQLADHNRPECSFNVIHVKRALEFRIPVLLSEPVALPSLLCGLILLMCISRLQSPKSPLLATSRRLPSATLVPTHLFSMIAGQRSDNANLHSRRRWRRLLSAGGHVLHCFCCAR